MKNWEEKITELVDVKNSKFKTGCMDELIQISEEIDSNSHLHDCDNNPRGTSVRVKIDDNIFS